MTRKTTTVTPPRPAAPSSPTSRRPEAATAPETPARHSWSRGWRAQLVDYLAVTVLTMAVVTVSLRLWRAAWTRPFFYTGDAVSSGAHVKATLEQGWYEYQPDLGAPYGQHFHDFPFSDNLHLVIARVLGLFTDSWPLVFNLYYVAAFLLIAWATLWFLRREGVARPLAVVLAVLYAIAPYHFIKNENHYFLAAYWTVPLVLAVVMDAVRGEPLWSRNPRIRGPLAYATGRGARTFVLLVLVGSATAYYDVFGAVLLASAGLVAFARTRRWTRLGGVVAAGAVLAGTLLANLLPDLLYARQNGSNALALVRPPGEAEYWGFKLTSLLLPAPGHPIAALAAFRDQYDATRPLGSEQPALGTICAVAFVVVLVIGIGRIAHREPRPATPEVAARRAKIADLSFVTIVAFLFGTIGGLGAVVGFVSEAVRGWNRMAIFLSLLLLAVVGIGVQGGVAWARGRWRSPRLALLTPLAAVLLLVFGTYDQQTAGAVPPYQQAANAYNSDEAFVRQLLGTVPVGSMLFQLPYQAFPESGPAVDAFDSDPLRLSLHSNDLRWSGGGIKGRPQSDWSAGVAQEPPQQAVDLITRMGFTGIVVDRYATRDRGAALEAAYRPFTGPPAFTSPDGRWAFLSLQRQLAQANATTTPQQRLDFQAKTLSGQR